jgi:hypothetical protein
LNFYLIIIIIEWLLNSSVIKRSDFYLVKYFICVTFSDVHIGYPEAVIVEVVRVGVLAPIDDAVCGFLQKVIDLIFEVLVVFDTFEGIIEVEGV